MSVNLPWRATVSRRVPRSMLTGPNCVTAPVGNVYARGRHSYKVGETLLVDLDAVPKHDDFVIVFGQNGPFGRICHIAPHDLAPRDEMVMGVLDTDGESVCMIDLGKDGRPFGVVVGVVPGKRT